MKDLQLARDFDLWILSDRFEGVWLGFALKETGTGKAWFTVS